MKPRGFRPTRPVALYRLYDKHDRLLYVGISRNPTRRLAEHARTKAWWPLVATQAPLQWYVDTTDALGRPVSAWTSAHRAEIATIRAEQPIYNWEHNEANPDRVWVPPLAPVPVQGRLGLGWVAIILLVALGVGLGVATEVGPPAVQERADAALAYLGDLGGLLVTTVVGIATDLLDLAAAAV